VNNDDLEIMAAKSRLIRDLLEETLSRPATYTDYLYWKVENDAKQRLGFY
jgi:hypothetical protein